ncbi:MAG: response regulator, partial [Planctomycetota bacterium]
MARKLHALVVDDSVMTRKMIMKSLQETGLADFSFTEAEDGLDAIESYKPDSYDLMFVDMNMPRMDGVSFLQKLKELDGNRPPAVMITAEAQQEIVHDAIARADVDAFLLKPVDTARMLKGLSSLVQSIPDRNSKWSVQNGEIVAEAFQKTVGQMCSLDLREINEDEAPSGDIVFGMISVVGQVQWSITLGFSGPAAAGVVSKFAGMEIDFDSPDLGDGIGELANLTAGEIKRLLADRGLDVEITLPNVMAARDFRTLVQRKRRTNE